MPGPGKALVSDAVIYLPGVMGSELVDANGKVVWGMSPRLLARQAFFGDVLERLKPTPTDGIRASRPVQLPIPVPLLAGIEPYTQLENRLRAVTLRDDAVRPFAFDWRRSIADAAKALAPVARNHLADWRRRFDELPEEERRGRRRPQLVLVGHSMGGLVASWFATAMRDEGGDDVRLVVTLGTPFLGSVNAVRVLATGEYFPLRRLAKALRDATRTMPGIYELVAGYDCVDEGDDDDGLPRAFRRLSPADLGRIGADPSLAADAQSTIAKLAAAVAAEADGRIRCLIGTTQPTLQSVRFRDDGEVDFAEAVADESRRREDHAGDGTVYRYAAMPDGVAPGYLPQSHGALAKANEAIQFAADVVTERPLRPFQAGSEIGLRVPEVAVVGKPFAVEAVEAELGAMCQVFDAESNAPIAMQLFERRNGALVTDVLPPAPGVLRICAASSGFSPVERLVLVADRS